MKEWRLTIGEVNACYPRREDVGKAGQKKLVEWGNELCIDHKDFHIVRMQRKHQCPRCWQELLDALGVK